MVLIVVHGISTALCVVERMSGPGDTLYRLVSDRVPVVGIDAGLGETHTLSRT